MRTLTCSSCGAAISQENINVAKDFFYCPACQKAGTISAQISDVEISADYSRGAPAGTWERSEMNRLVVGARCFEWGALLGQLFTAVFWNGILSLFLLVFGVFTLQSLKVPLPEQLNFIEKKPENFPPGMLVFFWLFITPFVAIGLWMIYSVFDTLFGKIELLFDRGNLVIKRSVGPFSTEKNIQLANLAGLAIKAASTTKSGNPINYQIELTERDGIIHKLGRGIPTNRLGYLLHKIRQQSRDPLGNIFGR
jgi:hypothetical protein